MILKEQDTTTEIRMDFRRAYGSRINIYKIQFLDRFMTEGTIVRYHVGRWRWYSIGSSHSYQQMAI